VSPLDHSTLTPVFFKKRLLKWFDLHKRDLPWRKTTDPYAVFVSEMMLQQTQVKTVIPYYKIFLRELPDWASLAKAREQKILKLWEGLGYYRRVRNLRAAAKLVVSQFKGRLPETLEEIQKLPGIGPYSAGAILSIAYQKPFPLVDGNVMRVYSRIFLLRGNLKSGEGRKKVWSLAQKYIPNDRPGDFNQALMELGATLCLPENPRCPLCPLFFRCGAARKGVQGKLPEMEKASPAIEVSMAALLIVKKGKFLLRKRSGKERWLKGLWEFPSTEGKTHRTALKKLEKQLKVKARSKEWWEVKHQITHHKILLRLYQASGPPGGNPPSDTRWVTAKELAILPFPSAQGRLRRWLLNSRRKKVRPN
jgi:A/G-specific adenine glycosylase